MQWVMRKIRQFRHGKKEGGRYYGRGLEKVSENQDS